MLLGGKPGLPGATPAPGPSRAPGSGCRGGRVLGAGGWGGTRPALAASLVGGGVPTAPLGVATLFSTLPMPAPALAPLPARRLGRHVPSCGRGPACPHSWLCVLGGGTKCLKRGQGVPEGEMGVSRGRRSPSKGPKCVQRRQAVPKGVWMSPNSQEVPKEGQDVPKGGQEVPEGELEVPRGAGCPQGGQNVTKGVRVSLRVSGCPHGGQDDPEGVRTSLRGSQCPQRAQDEPEGARRSPRVSEGP